VLRHLVGGCPQFSSCAFLPPTNHAPSFNKNATPLTILNFPSRPRFFLLSFISTPFQSIFILSNLFTFISIHLPQPTLVYTAWTRKQYLTVGGSLDRRPADTAMVPVKTFSGEWTFDAYSDRGMRLISDGMGTLRNATNASLYRFPGASRDWSDIEELGGKRDADRRSLPLP
jgi:hypothetical protein